MYGKFHLFNLGAAWHKDLKSVGFEFLSLRSESRLPLTALAFGLNFTYWTFNISLLGFYLEREVYVTEEKDIMRWCVDFIGLRDVSIDYVRENGWFRKLVTKIRGGK